MMQGRAGTNSKRVLTLNRSTVLPSVFTDPPPSCRVLAGLVFLSSCLTFGCWIGWMGETWPDPSLADRGLTVRGCRDVHDGLLLRRAEV